MRSGSNERPENSLRSFLKASPNLSATWLMTTPTAGEKIWRSIHMVIARASPSRPLGKNDGDGRRRSSSSMMSWVSQ